MSIPATRLKILRGFLYQAAEESALSECEHVQGNQLTLVLFPSGPLA